MLAALLVGCGGVRPAFTDPAKPLRVAAGETFVLQLAANDTTPYR